MGVSIDGPEFLHNANRKNWNNIGSFSKSLDGFIKLKQHGLNIGVLSVITALHLEHPRE